MVKTLRWTNDHKILHNSQPCQQQNYNAKASPSCRPQCSWGGLVFGSGLDSWASGIIPHMHPKSPPKLCVSVLLLYLESSNTFHVKRKKTIFSFSESSSSWSQCLSTQIKIRRMTAILQSKHATSFSPYFVLQPLSLSLSFDYLDTFSSWVGFLFYLARSLRFFFSMALNLSSFGKYEFG